MMVMSDSSDYAIEKKNILYTSVYDAKLCNFVQSQFYDMSCSSESQASKTCTLFESIESAVNWDK